MKRAGGLKAMGARQWRIIRDMQENTSWYIREGYDHGERETTIYMTNGEDDFYIISKAVMTSLIGRKLFELKTFSPALSIDICEYRLLAEYTGYAREHNS
jgi:hypothetical protein